MKNQKSKSTKELCAGAAFLAAFLIWTLLICTVDVQPIGPRGSRVGFAALNGAFHAATGVHMGLYTVTDWLGLVPLGAALFFAMLGLVQLLRRKSVFKVDGDILALGVFYFLVMGAYLLFEVVAINHRPVLIDGYLEASYPSSTTLLTLCVMPTAILQLKHRVKSERVSRAGCAILWAFTVFMVMGRLVSGVHWLTDIAGGALLSAGLVLPYCAVFDWLAAKGAKRKS